MRKAKQIHPSRPAGGKRPTPTQAAQFLDDYAKLFYGQDEPSQLISLRVPANVLRTFKALAASKGQRYQPQIVRLMREWITSQQK